MLTIEYEYNEKIYKYYVGKNKKENWEIIDNANENDVWFHVNNLPSCHVIFENTDNNKDINDKLLLYGAFLCKKNSKFKNFNKLSIIYTKVKNVKKTNEIGAVTTTRTKKIII